MGPKWHVDCADAAHCPDGQKPLWQWEKYGPDQRWFGTGNHVCTTRTVPDTTATDQEVAAHSADAFKLLTLPGPPVITISPASGPIVQLPMIVSATPEARITQDVTLDLPGFPPIPLTVTATPHWTFDLGQGTAVRQDDPGTPYDGTDPVDHPEHYVESTYHHLGTAHLAVTVTWTATAKRHDTGATLTLPGSKTDTATKAVPIHEARAVLTG